MKSTLSLVALTWVVSLACARADLTILDSSYQASDYYTHNTSDSIVSYDWDSTGNLYYETSTPSFNFGGFYEANGATPTTLAPGTSEFSGASVVSIGGFVYFNTSDTQQKIYAYGPVNGGSPGVNLISTAANYGLYNHNGQLYITGAIGFSTNHIYTTGTNANGTLKTNPPTDLGEDSGSSGPLAFDAAGNLYYAPGFGDLSIYKWSAADVAAALANPTLDPLTAAGHLWADYSLSYGQFSGGTSMIIDGNQVLLTLTNFSDPSELIAFGIGTNGTYNDSSTLILEGGDILGELREHNGNLYLSDGNQIIELSTTPEPSSVFLLAVGGLVLWIYRRRSRAMCRVRVLRAGLIAALFVVPAGLVKAGPFSPAADQPGSTGVAATDPSIVGWASGVVSFNPGPVDISNPSGAKASFGTPANALGASDATADNPYPVVSLGDGGSITLSFAKPIANGAGADFAVYENAFAVNGLPNAYFLELAYVSVSSDGVNFFTFPSVSLTQTSTQVGGFGNLDPTNIYNLAGTEIAGYGTPFNLDDLIGVSPLLNLNNITEVRVTDVIGNINTALGAGTYSSDDATNPIFDGKYGDTDHLINDPWKTNFNTGGFDLDAIAELNVAPEPGVAGCLLVGGFLLAGWTFLRRLGRV